MYEIDSTELIHILELIPPHLKDLGIYSCECDPYEFESPNTLCIDTNKQLSDDIFGALKKLIDTAKVFYRCSNSEG